MMNLTSGRAFHRLMPLILVPLLALAGWLAAAAWAQTGGTSGAGDGEFHFVRVIYTDLPNYSRYGRGWWSQDWPEAETHFAEGVGRLTRLDIGRAETLDLLSEELYDYPWLYATQVGYWDLSDEEIDALRKYLDRGGFLFVDDFFAQEWAVFERTMNRLYPNRPIVEFEPGDEHEALHVYYDLEERTQIPGLRHLRGRFRGGGFSTGNLPEPHWRGILDDQGRLVVAVNYNMDVGDAWEHANDPFYPEPMTALSYRLAINYTIYALTH